MSWLRTYTRAAWDGLLVFGTMAGVAAWLVAMLIVVGGIIAGLAGCQPTGPASPAGTADRNIALLDNAIGICLPADHAPVRRTETVVYLSTADHGDDAIHCVLDYVGAPVGTWTGMLDSREGQGIQVREGPGWHLAWTVDGDIGFDVTLSTVG